MGRLATDGIAARESLLLIRGNPPGSVGSSAGGLEGGGGRPVREIVASLTLSGSADNVRGLRCSRFDMLLLLDRFESELFGRLLPELGGLELKGGGG